MEGKKEFEFKTVLADWTFFSHEYEHINSPYQSHLFIGSATLSTV